ncbi:MAG TPA: cellulase family glycosylhydrolase [Candidatus Methylacidiphilales bacterium]|nr:cellulase family glycosylhydrolase [Candidatus Methylacidiphilales bacterium]
MNVTRASIFVLVLVSALLNGDRQGWAQPAEGGASAWKVSGKAIVDPSGRPIHPRGFNVCWWVPVTDQDAADIQRVGANCVRYMFGYEPRGTYDPAQVSEVEAQVRSFTKRGIWVIPVLYECERKDAASGRTVQPWDDPQLNREFLALWTDLVRRLGSDPLVVAWEPLNEPHGGATPATIAAWYRGVITQFRRYDPSRPIVVEGANYSHPEDLVDAIKMADPNIIYAFHFYYPYEYTTDLRNPPLDYPGEWGKSYLEQKMAPALRFREKFNVPVWCGEWGTKTGAAHYERWMNDVFGILHANGLDWCMWAWARPASDPRNASFDINPDKADVYRLMPAFFGQAGN